MNNHKNNRIKFVLLNIFWALIIAFLSYRMPPYVDDYYHKVSFMDGAEITRISQIFPSVYTYYMTWGGRAVSMFFIQLMLMLPKWVFVICNAVIYVLVANVIYRYAVIGSGLYGGRRDDASKERIKAGRVAENSKTFWLAIDDENSVIVLSAIYIMLWFFMPDFAEVVTWITGSATYLWTNLVILVFGLLYYRDFCAGESAGTTRNECAGTSTAITNAFATFLLCVLYVVLGFLAGLSNEAGACTLLVALAIFAFAMIWGKRKLEIYHVLGAISAAVGAAFLIIAPGNSVRVQASDASNAGVLMKYLFRIGREGFYGVMFLAVPVIVCTTVYLYSMYTSHASKWFSIELIFYVLAFISIFVMTFSAGFANRIYQLPLLLICVGFALSLRRIIERDGAQEGDVPEKTLSPLYKSLSVMVVLLTMVVLFEVAAGTIYSSSKGSFFDRQVIYYHIYDTEGALSGNGM